MVESTDPQLQELFASANSSLEPDVLAELTSIMRLHQIDPQELWYKWESYSLRMGGDDMKLSLDTARALKQDVQDGLERENRSKAQSLSSNRRGAATPRNVTNTSDVYGV
jgi:DNA polymerase alpha subunit B